MSYRKLALQTLPTWAAVSCFNVSPGGNPIGNARQAATGDWFVVIWGLDGSIISNVGPFQDIAGIGALNSVRELMIAVVPKGASRPRPVLIYDDKVVRDFAELVLHPCSISAFNTAGIAIGGEAIGATPNTRAFALDVRGTGSVRYFEPPPGTVSAAGAALNEAGDIVVTGNSAAGDVHSMLYSAGVEARDLGPYGISDINRNRLCAGFSLDPDPRAGLLDASGATPLWTEIPLPEAAEYSVAMYVNDKAQCVGIISSDDSDSRSVFPFMWSGGVLKEFDELVPGSYFMPQGLGEGGQIAVADEGRPVVLTPARVVRAGVDLGRPLWEIVLIPSTTGDAPVFGVGGVTVRLPNGNVINLPVLPIPNDPTPGPTWAGLNEGQRVALVATAVAGLASRLDDQHAQAVLARAARDMLAHTHRH